MEDGSGRGFTDEELERYLRDPGSMSADDRLRLQDLLEKSKEASYVAESIRSFYAELGATNERPDPALDALLHELCASGFVVRLYPLRREVPSANEGDEAMATLMAAATEAFETAPMLWSNCYASVEGDVLVRVVHDREGERRVFVLSEDPVRRAHCVVTIPALSLDIPVDERGRGGFSGQTTDDPDFWDQLGALVRFPLGECPFPPLKSLPPGQECPVHGVVFKDHVLEAALLPDAVNLTVKGRIPGAALPTLLIIRDLEDSVMQYQLDDGTAAVGKLVLSNGGTMRIYA